jgi:hypothetical protein
MGARETRRGGSLCCRSRSASHGNIGGVCLQTYAQYSYLTRAPWFLEPGTPKNAHLSMVYAGFRYVFPSTSGTLERVPYPN